MPFPTMASRSIVQWAVAFLCLSLHLENLTALAQDCYYPNGTLSDGSSREAPCGTSDGICCPLDWQCMSNGLCYYPPDQYYGRYSCTDPTWKSCPDICTYDYTAFGGEAILQCSNGKWCCDHNRVSGVCCDEDDAEFFDLKDPTSLTSITALAPVTQPASTVHNAQSTTSENTTPFTSSTSSPTSSLTTKSTVTHESLTTGTDGAVSTITQVKTIYPSNTAQAEAAGGNSSSGTNIGMIVGLALGIPLVLILAGIATFCCWRRRRETRRYNNLRMSSPPLIANYNNIPEGTHAPELGGFPVADTREKDDRKSELYGNDTYIYSPTISNHSKSSPPSYSSNGRSPVTQAKSPAMAQIQEEPQELWGGYVPYRPQNAQLPDERKGEGEVGTGTGTIGPQVVSPM